MYTDGACIGNPGPGGYGVVLVANGHRKELSAGYRLTTNNRMEIMAVIAGLEALRTPCVVKVFSDSQYVVYGIEKGWAVRWRARGWMRTSTEKAVNTDLWERLLQLCEQHEVSFEWVKGHAGLAENERCDRLSVAAASGSSLLEDEGYAESKQTQLPGLFPADAGFAPAAPDNR
jgi:ribonuclease HI